MPDLSLITYDHPDVTRHYDWGKWKSIDEAIRKLEKIDTRYYDAQTCIAITYAIATLKTIKGETDGTA
jgi:hypothetical protein